MVRSAFQISVHSVVALLWATACGGGDGSTGSTAVGGASDVPIGGGTAFGGSSTQGGTSSGSLGSTAFGGTSTQGGTSSGSLGGFTNVATGGASVGQGGMLATGGTSANGGSLATGGSVTTGGTSTACAAPPPASILLGWAAVTGNGVTTTTGGGSVTPVTVNTLAAFRTAVSGTAPGVIYVTGVLDAGNILVGSNKTIAGLCGAEIHGHLELSSSANVIIRNIKIVGYGVGDCSKDPSFNPAIGCSSGVDAITVQNSAHHIWFDHCDVSDGTDGNLDISKASDYITVSFTKFHYTPRTDLVGSDSTGTAGHRYSNLIGGSTTEASTGKLNITWHHNWWADNVRERQPQVRFGKNHLFNNLWTSTGDNYCVRAAYDAHILLESNVFTSVKDPHLFYTGATSDSSITADSTNVYTSTTGNKTTGGSGAAYTSSGYAFTADPVAQVSAIVTAEAGPK